MKDKNRKYTQPYLSLALVGAIAGLLALSPSLLAGQGSAPAKNWTPPRTAWGDPDLQGVWQGSENVPLERALELGDKEFFTDEEVAAMVAKQVAEAKARNALIGEGKVEHQGFRAVPNYNQIFGYSEGVGTPRISKRTSAIIDPPNGRIPPWTQEQVKYWEQREALTKGRGETDTTDDMNLATRCISVVSAPELTNWGMAFGGGPVTVEGRPEIESENVDLGDGYGLGASAGPSRRIMQYPGYVAFVFGDTPTYRIVPLDGRPHPSAKIRQWMGDARGHWEGSTLVVDITNITYGSPIIPNYGGGLYPGSGATLHMIERFRPVDANSIEYTYTIDDPAVYVQPYTVRHTLRKGSSSSAGATSICQEDPKDMAHALANARADEQSSLQYGEDSIAARKPRFEQIKQEAIAAANRLGAKSQPASSK